MLLVPAPHTAVGQAALAALSAEGADARARPVDLDDPATWSAALQGVTGLLIERGAGDGAPVDPLASLVDAAPAGAHVVFVSTDGAESNPALPQGRLEAHLRASGRPWTMLRAALPCQHLGDACRQDIVEDDRLFVPAGKGGVAWVDARDVGAVAARALRDPAARGATWRLTGREVLDFDAVAAILSDELDRPIAYTAANPVFYAKHLALRRGRTWEQAGELTLLHLGIRFGDPPALDPTLQQQLGRPPRTVRDYVRDAAASFTRAAPR